MKRIAPLIFLAASSLVFAQQPSQEPAGVWRHVGDPPPASTPAATSNSAQNPEPVAQDQSGQTQSAGCAERPGGRCGDNSDAAPSRRPCRRSLRKAPRQRASPLMAFRPS